MKNRTNAIIFSSILVIAVIAIALIIGIIGKRPVKMGFIADLTGRQSALGVTVRNGFLLAVEELNQSGGIDGREIITSIKTTEADPEVSRTHTEELVNEEVDVIIGPLISSMAAPVLEGSGDTLVISPTVSTDSMTGIDDMFIRIIATASRQGQGLARALLNNNEENAIIVIDERNLDYSGSFAEGLIDVYRGEAGKEIETIRYNDKSQFISIAETISAAAPDALIFASSGIDAAGIIQQISKTAELPSLYSSYWGKASDINKFGGRTVEGMIIVAAYANEVKTEREIEFENAYFSRYQVQPNFAAQYAYECVMLYAAAVKKSGSLKPLKVKEAVLGLESFDGITDSYRLDEFGDVLRDQTLFVIRDNQYEFY